MGYYYNSNCNTQTCSYSCCDYYGNCPDFSSGNTNSLTNTCWYYYTYCTSSADPYCSSSSSSSICLLK